MQVYGNITQPVSIDPIDVIKNLIDDEIGQGNWLFEEDGKYYLGYEISAGTHAIDRREEITEDNYKYVKALELILANLNDKKTRNR